MKDIVIIGSGGFSKQVIEIIESRNQLKQEYNLIGLIDDDINSYKKIVLGYEVIGDTHFLMEYSKTNEIFAVIAIADAKVRRDIDRRLTNVKWTNLVHPSAIITNYHRFGIGNVICAGVVINPDFSMGNHCHINIGSLLGHDIEFHDYVTVMPGCKISGDVLINSNVFLGAGSTIIQGLEIEENVILGAGAVLVTNAATNNTYIGVPAKSRESLYFRV